MILLSLRQSSFCERSPRSELELRAISTWREQHAEKAELEQDSWVFVRDTAVSGSSLEAGFEYCFDLGVLLGSRADVCLSCILLQVAHAVREVLFFPWSPR
jgi:hypothetical protein